uniref:Uncharacterized protein n=1 Tax=Sphaerodactylus townsendi TaxID=933632 RepID=A0ACB8FC21_9SAUR
MTWKLPQELGWQAQPLIDVLAHQPAAAGQRALCMDTCSLFLLQMACILAMTQRLGAGPALPALPLRGELAPLPPQPGGQAAAAPEGPCACVYHIPAVPWDKPKDHVGR